MDDLGSQYGDEGPLRRVLRAARGPGVHTLRRDHTRNAWAFRAEPQRLATPHPDCLRWWPDRDDQLHHRDRHLSWCKRGGRPRPCRRQQSHRHRRCGAVPRRADGFCRVPRGRRTRDDAQRGARTLDWSRRPHRRRVILDHVPYDPRRPRRRQHVRIRILPRRRGSGDLVDRHERRDIPHTRACCRRVHRGSTKARCIRRRRGCHGRVADPPLSRSGRRSSQMTLPSTMNAAVHDRYGDADVISVGKRPVPAVSDDEVLIRVQAAGLDRGTWHLLTGRPYLVRLATGLRQPRVAVLGRDVAGTVVATGSAVHRLAVGDPVFGVATGSFAEYAGAKERKLARTPDVLSPAEAAVLGISGMTALQAIDAAEVKAGSSLLIIGASGGVGSYSVQIAQGRGARVTGVARAAKADFVRSLGADRVIAYDTAPDNDYGGPYDAVIDTGGDTALAKLRSMLASRGTLVIVGGEGGDAVTGMGRQ